MNRSLAVSFVCALLCAAGLVPCKPVCGQVVRSTVMPETTAVRHGLHRAWAGQVQLDRLRDKIAGAALSTGGLFVLSVGGTLDALDAETGLGMWSTRCGNRNYPSVGPAANQKYVAFVNGTTLYVLRRGDGEIIFERSLQHVATTSPALRGERAFVALFNGTIASYEVRQGRRAPWIYNSPGMFEAPPLATPASVAWATDKGWLFCGTADGLGVRFKFRTSGSIEGPIAYANQRLYVASASGYVYAVEEMTGRMAWRFSAGSPVTHQPIVLGSSVYVFPDAGGVFCLAESSGRERWFSPRAAEFVAASPLRGERAKPKGKPQKEVRSEEIARLYVADKLGQTHVLDAETGATLDRLDTSAWAWKFTNVVNDRLYLGTTSGMIQCLHELDLEKPVYYEKPIKTSAPADGSRPTRPAPPAEEEGGEAATDEAAEAEMPAEDAGEAEMPAEEGADPFDDEAEAAGREAPGTPDESRADDANPPADERGAENRAAEEDAATGNDADAKAEAEEPQS
ncbi:MAG: PQQ-binding-like beta-propeller repeat protein [Pirellulales bacterium]|nr:PQQ-binding-like beta-propeller repeat protein [Pirellulales bacterium]